MTELATARRLYAAFEARDPAGLLAVLHHDFRGDVTAGLPNDWGGTYVGAEMMLRECWGPVLSVLDTRPVPDEIVTTVDGRVLVIGHYRGTARRSGRPHEAAFTHLLGFEDGLIASLRQVTDSYRWHEALA